MGRKRSDGRIITFYSYKGGVGRTMALANIAFLAASNGYRVLTMDWDLEAPGLHYYFRGLMEAPHARSVKESPGILNLVWDWTSSLEMAGSAKQMNEVFARFDAPETYASYVHTVYEPPDGGGGRLDFINAGSAQIFTPDPTDYGDALATFAWPKFFSEDAGGSVLEQLRNWAKAEYDFILIDSRTGLADVSGICTTQLPDAVALCFILNRQNVDGVAKVAAAIRSRRGDAVELRAVPMRVADKGGEGSRARAINELKNRGGFSAEEVNDDFRLLSVRADTVPYYETLAPFEATDLATDPMSLTFLRIATRLLKTPLELPDLPEDWIGMVKRRLEPRQVTIQYVTELAAEDPGRAVDEVESLLEAAYEAVVDQEEVSEEYITVLIDTALQLSGRAEGPFGPVGMMHRMLDLLRALYANDVEKWRASLTVGIERHLETVGFYLPPEEELALLEELDGLLAFNNALATRLRRLTHRRRTARIYIFENDLDAAQQTVGEIMQLSREGGDGAKIASDQADQLLAAQIEAHFFRGEIAQKQQDWHKAYHELNLGLQLMPPPSGARNEFARLAFELNGRLARLPSEVLSPEEAAERAVIAVQFAAQLSSGSVLPHFTDLATVVVRALSRPDLAYTFCELTLEANDRRLLSQLGSYLGRTPRSAALCFSLTADLVRLVAKSGAERTPAMLGLLAELAVVVSRHLERRRHTMGERVRDASHTALQTVLLALADVNAPPGAITAVYELVQEGGRQRPPSGQPAPPPPRRT